MNPQNRVDSRAAGRRPSPEYVRRADALLAGPPVETRDVVEIRVLGPLQARVGGDLVELGAPKQRALLALLVGRVDRPVTVDMLVDALWDGCPPSAATTSVQAYVANLRRALEPDRAPRTPATVLRTSARGYRLDGDAVTTDVRWFDEHTAAGRRYWDEGDAHRTLQELEAGLALWRGEAYTEIGGVGPMAPEVSRLDELRLSAAEMRCAALLAVGAVDVAVAELEAFTRAHPLREHGCELLGRALYRAGRQADALEVLRGVQARLADELGVDPTPALRRLEHEILTHSPALHRPTADVPRQTAASPVTAAPAVSTPAPAARADDEVFVGRAAELRLLHEAVAGATHRGQVVTLTGETGIGKTALLRRFAGRADVPVVWGTCPEHVDTPSLWPWEQVLRSVTGIRPRTPVPAAVAELLNTDGRAPGRGAHDAGAIMRRFEAVARYLTDVAESGTVVVVLDHMQRADPVSLQLVAHLAELVRSSSLLLVVSYRSDDPGLPAATVAALARTGGTRIELRGLTPPETTALARAVLPGNGDGEVGDAVTDALRDRTDGHPFFLHEFLKVLDGHDPDHEVPVPVAARDVVLRRIARLPRAAVDMLAVAAVAGRRFDLEVVAAAVSVEVDTALEVLDTAVAAGLVVEDPQGLGWYRFSQGLLVETLRETTGRLRRERTRRRIDAVRHGRSAHAERPDLPMIRIVHDPEPGEGLPERGSAG